MARAFPNRSIFQAVVELLVLARAMLYLRHRHAHHLRCCFSRAALHISHNSGSACGASPGQTRQRICTPSTHAETLARPDWSMVDPGLERTGDFRKIIPVCSISSLPHAGYSSVRRVWYLALCPIPRFSKHQHPSRAPFSSQSSAPPRVSIAYKRGVWDVTDARTHNHFQGGHPPWFNRRDLCRISNERP